MAIDVTVETFISVPRARVAAYMFEPRNDRVWTTGVVDSRPLTDGPLREGSRVERVSKFLGRTFGYTYEVIAAEAERSVDMKVEKPFPMDIRYELTDRDGGTLASIRARGEAGGFFRLAAPLLARMVRRNIGKDLAKLRATLEQR